VNGTTASQAPADFPRSIPVYQRAFANWSDEIVLSPQWTCAPKNPEEVVTLANWAHINGWKLRARGMGHGWSPLLAPKGADGKILLVDTTRYLTAVTVCPGNPASVTAQSGVTMLEIEQWVLSHYTGSYAAVRAEWSKGWAYSGSAAWADPAMLGAAIPNSLHIGQGSDAGWDTALVILDRYDPGRIYSNTFLETLMP
jgi:FAD/FMN-containing dehydrogenase